jgi:hypothetical protein
MNSWKADRLMTLPRKLITIDKTLLLDVNYLNALLFRWLVGDLEVRLTKA